MAVKYVPQASPQQKLEFWRDLKLEELALARACAAGHDSAWQAFLTRFREKLYDIARGITKEDSSARDLADSLYADLYGTSEKEGRRVSRLNFYMGRGSSGRLVTNGAGPGIRQSLPQDQAPGEP